MKQFFDAAEVARIVKADRATAARWIEKGILGADAADLILVPASAERMAVDGVGDLITHVQKTMWDKLAFPYQELRILFTLYRSTTSHCPAIVANARKIWRDNVLSVKIPHSTVFAKSYDEKIPIGKLESRHPGAIAYDMLADWLIEYEKTANSTYPKPARKCEYSHYFFKSPLVVIDSLVFQSANLG